MGDPGWGSGRRTFALRTENPSKKIKNRPALLRLWISVVRSAFVWYDRFTFSYTHP